MKSLSVFILSLLLFSCSSDNSASNETPGVLLDLSQFFSINFSDLPNYSDQYIPIYINKDNTPSAGMPY